jgi:hypothetical protein
MPPGLALRTPSARFRVACRAAGPATERRKGPDLAVGPFRCAVDQITPVTYLTLWYVLSALYWKMPMVALVGLPVGPRSHGPETPS